MTLPLVAALDVGGTGIKAALRDRHGQLHARREVNVASLRGDERLVDAVLEVASEMVREGRGGRVAALGLAVPGIVDEVRGIAVSSMILGWREVPFVDLLGRRTGLPIGFGHDVRLAARAEGQVGAARECRNWLFVTLGTGVGATMVLHGRHYLGSTGRGGELAHFVVEPEGPPCRCGKIGCLEMVASADAVARRYAELRPDDQAVTARDVTVRAGDGDAVARAVWHRAVLALGRALSTYAELLDPELIVVGGGMASAGAALFDPLNELVSAGVSLPRTPPVVPAALGPFAGVHGAALAAEEVAGG